MAQKEKLEEAKRLYQTANADRRYVLESLFPELKESEDERIRKEIYQFVYEQRPEKEWIAWLEKQGSQNNTEDEDLLYRFCFYSYKDESNILYLSGLYVNGECRNKGIGTKILEVADEVAKNLNCYAIRLKTEIGSNAERLYRRNGYNTFKREGNNVWLEKQGEQKPTLPKWKYKKDNTTLLKDSLVLNKCGHMAKLSSGAIVSDVWALDYDELAKLPKEELEEQGEQNPTDNVEPKFKVGDRITKSSKKSCPVHSSIDDTICEVTEVHDTCYILNTKEGRIQEPFEWQDYYELVEPAWSKEDNWIKTKIIKVLLGCET